MRKSKQTREQDDLYCFLPIHAPRSENRRQVLARKDSSNPVVEDSRRIASPRPLPQSTSASVRYKFNEIHR